MDAKLDALIDKIKKDGIAKAKQTGDEIITAAQAQAKKIIEEAKKEAVDILNKAEKDASRFENNAKVNIEQAARDLKLSLRQKLIEVFDSLLKEHISSELASDFLKNFIIKVASSWPSKESGLEIIIPAKDKESLQKMLQDDFKKSAHKTIELKVSADIANGFRIGVKGQDLYYDFSDESLTEALRVFANPALKNLL